MNASLDQMLGIPLSGRRPYLETLETGRCR